MHRFKTWQLLAGCVLIWGTTWHAITYQLSDLAPEFGVAIRFLIAGGSVVAFALWRGERLRFPLAAHASLALQGAFLYGVSYVCVYHAERFVASGLVAVGYSASPLLNGLGAAALFGVAVRLPTAESSTEATVKPRPSVPRSPPVGRAISGQNMRATPASPRMPPTTKRPPTATPKSAAAPRPFSSGEAE